MEFVELEVWRNAMSSEQASLEISETFQFGPAKTLKTLISTSIILQKKLNEKNEVERYKVRLVAHGFRQRPGIDFDKTLAPLASIATVRLVWQFSGVPGWA